MNRLIAQQYIIIDKSVINRNTSNEHSRIIRDTGQRFKSRASYENERIESQRRYNNQSEKSFEYNRIVGYIV